MAEEPGTGQAVQSPPGAQLPETQPLEIPKVSTSASRRVRARLARRMTAQRSTVNPVLEPLVAVHKETHPKADLTLLQRAYEVAEQRHADQLRRSGDPYITHPLAVANILAELGMDTTTLVAALLHDTVEDTGYTLEALTAEFGDEVGHLVDGVTKLDKVVLGNAAEGETIRKMIIAMAHDPRVLVIKLADRLHNMRTMRFLPPEKQARKARETLEVIAPLAHRLGMATVKWELEDLAFSILHPKKYEEIVRLVADRAPSRDTYLAKVRAEITATLDRVEDQGRGGGQAQALLVDLPEDERQGPRLRRDPRPGRGAHPVRRGPRLLCRYGRCAFAVAADARAGSRTTSPSRGSACTSRCTPPSSAQKASRWRCRSAPATCTSTAEYGIAAHWRYKEPRAATGFRPATRPPRSTTWPGCASCSTGSGRPPIPANSWSLCVTTLRCRRSSCSPRRAT